MGGESAGSNPHGRIVRALIVGVLFIGVAKIAGLAKELAMAWRFGSGPVADAYALTFSLASWPAAVWVSVATVLIVPLMVAVRRDDPDTLDLLRRELVAAALVLGAGLGLVVYVGLNLGLTQEWFLASERAAEARRMVGPLALTVPLAAVSAVLAAWLISAQRQINTLFEGAPSLLLFGVLAAMPMADGAVVAWATLAGFALYLLLLGLVQEKPALILRSRLGFKSPQWSGLWQGLGVLVASQALVSVSGVVDQLSVASLGPTSNATIGYASRLLLLVQTLGSLAIVRALLPVLANADYGCLQARWRIALQWTMILAVGGAVVAALGWFLTPWCVELLLQRGDFTPADTIRVSEAVRFGLAQIPFYCASVVLGQYVAATQQYGLFLWGNGLNLLVKVAANALLIPSFGVPGAMLATAIMYAGSMTFLWILGRPSQGGPAQSVGVA